MENKNINNNSVLTENDEVSYKFRFTNYDKLLPNKVKKKNKLEFKRKRQHAYICLLSNTFPFFRNSILSIHF